jgi:endonuclease YncB( thermonuclease family)
MDTDKHGRTVARVWVGGRLLNRELVRAGMAWWYRKYAPEDRDIAAVEEQARKNKRGLWRAGDPVPPWLFRWKSQEE